MIELPEGNGPALLDERDPRSFRWTFGQLLRRSSGLETAMHRIRLSAVDLSPEEVEGLTRMRILVANINAQVLEEEAFSLLMDADRRRHFSRVLTLIREGRLELRSAPLAGWSPDFSIFSGPRGPSALILGLHWIRRPFPHRGPAWAAVFGAEEAQKAHGRFQELWDGAYEIGPAVHRILEGASSRRRWEKPQEREGKGLPDGAGNPVDTPQALG